MIAGFLSNKILLAKSATIVSLRKIIVPDEARLQLDESIQFLH